MLLSKVFLYIIMPHFSCSIAIGSKEVMEDPYDMVKNIDHCFMIFPVGLDSIFLDISMHCIEIIKIENKISIHRIEKKI